MNGKTTPGVWSRSNQKSAWGNFESAESHIEETLDFSVIIETHHSAVFSAWRFIKVLQTLSCDFLLLSPQNTLSVIQVIQILQWYMKDQNKKMNAQRNDSPWFTSGYGEDKSQ